MSVDRRLLLGALLGIAAVGVVWGAVVLAGNVSSEIFGPRCSAAHPDGSYSQAACPPMVVPPWAPDSVPVTVEAARHGGGIEGGIHFVEARSAEGQLVWYQPLVSQADYPPAAIGAAHLPPGSYAFTFYVRSCGGNCGSLDPPGAVCNFSYNTDGRDKYEVVIDWDWEREPCASERPATR